MKTKTVPLRVPTEAEIRDYAHHLYIQSGWLPGRDLENWLEAEAHLTAIAAARASDQHGLRAATMRRKTALFS